jgi:hypothetical protein
VRDVSVLWRVFVFSVNLEESEVSKSKAVPLRHAGAKVEKKYSSYSLTWALDGDEWSASRLGALYPREKTSGTHWIEGWMGLRAALDTQGRGKVVCLCRGSNPGPPVCNQTLD